MIAIITSTLQPAKGKSYFSFEDRVLQTKESLLKLQGAGFHQVFLIDNSDTLDQYQVEQLLADFPFVEKFHCRQYQFENKGINELLMLLALCREIPSETPVFKISGRYYPNEHFSQPDFKDVAVKGEHFYNRTGIISTRAYWVKNKDLLKEILLKTLDVIYTYNHEVTDLKALFKAFLKLVGLKTIPLNLSIEFAMATALKAGNYHILFLNPIGLEGYIAGGDHLHQIKE